MNQKELLEKLEGEPKDSGDQIRLIKKFFSYICLLYTSDAADE